MTASESVLNDLPAEKARGPGDSNMHCDFNSPAQGERQLPNNFCCGLWGGVVGKVGSTGRRERGSIGGLVLGWDWG
jgi:hypothetical protein